MLKECPYCAYETHHHEMACPYLAFVAQVPQSPEQTAPFRAVRLTRRGKVRPERAAA